MRMITLNLGKYIDTVILKSAQKHNRPNILLSDTNNLNLAMNNSTKI